MNCSNYPLFLGEPTIKFAEDNLCGWVIQPANTWSNLTYLVIALLISWDLSKTVNRNKVLWGFPVVASIIGLSSGFYHASATFVGQFLDFASIYILGAYLIYLVLSRRQIKQIHLLYLLGLLISALLLTLWFFPFLRIWLAFGLLFCLIYLELKSPLKPATFKNLYFALGFLALAFIPWLLDLFYIWDLDSLEHWVNGHAIWHIVNSISIYFGFRHYSQPLVKDYQKQV